MIPIKIVQRRTIWTALGREVLLEVHYSSGEVRTNWTTVHDPRQNLFQHYLR